MNEQLVARTEGQPLDGRPSFNPATRRSLYFTIAVAALLIIAAFFAGWAIAGGGGAKSTQLATQSTTTQSNASAFMGPTNSNTPYDLRFIDEMVAHHEGAIISVQAMITNSTHPELRDLGSRIVKVQQQQIDQMLTWRRQWYPDAPALNTANLDMGMDMMSGGTIGGWMMGSGALTDTNSTAPYGGMMGGGMMGSGTNLTPGTGPGNGGGYGMMGGRFASGTQSDQMFLRMMIPHHQIAIDMSQDALKNAQHPELKTLAQSIISGQSAEITEMEGYLKTWYNEDSTRNLAAPMEQMMGGMNR
ncbi:MAG: hypothetical protein DLM69_04520 [Candidatus Chloroheliales bacterium]|nr:MAG: hypothetical protein DLM69_04520 [Chloroflexota bacterium]